MDLRQLKYFVAIVECGTLTKAARRLHVVQPALSQRLAALEEELGVKLLVRSRSGLATTGAGQSLYEHAQIILKQTQVARDAVKETAGIVGGRVRIGVLRNLDPCVSTELFQAIKSELPDVQPDIVVGYTEELMQKIRTAQLDITLGAQEAMETSLNASHLFSEEICLLGAKEFFPRDRATLTVDDLHGIPLVAPPMDGPVHRMLEAAAAHRGFQLNFAGGVEDVASLRALCQKGLFAACVPECAVKHLNADGKLLALPIIGADLTRHIHIYTHKDIPKTGAVLAIENMLAKIALAQAPLSKPPKPLFTSHWRGIAEMTG